MTTLIISPLGEVSSVSEEIIQLQVVAADADFVGRFDLVELWRSTLGEGGPYEELTASSLLRARIPKDASDPPSPAIIGASVNVVAKSMELLVDEETQVPITFTGSDPLTYSQVATQITSQGLNLVESYVADDGRLVVQTLEGGLDARLRVVAGSDDDNSNAAEVLGLPTAEPASFARGRIPRQPLVPGRQTYLFTDPYSSRDYFYKTRFRNSSSGSVSDFSLPFGVGQSIGISQDNVICGRLEIVNIDGVPIANREVRLHVAFSGNLVEDKVVGGTDVNRLSDENGLVEFRLVRGQRVTVAIIGTDIARDIEVPTDPSITTFNLLDPSVVTGPDIFQVQVPEIITAERRSL